MKLGNFIPMLCVLVAPLWVSNAFAVTKSELESKKREVATFYSMLQKESNEYEQISTEQTILENKLDALDKNLADLKEELQGYESLPRKNMAIYEAMADVQGKIEAKESEIKSQNNQLITLENKLRNVEARVESSETKYKSANRSLNKLIDQAIQAETVAEIDKFEQPVKVSEREKVTCSRTETPDKCEQRGYDKAKKRIQESKQFITSKSVIRDFELESDVVQKYSSNNLSNVKMVLLEADYNRETRSEILTVEVTALVSAVANQELVARFADKIGLAYSQYRFVEGMPLTLDQEVNKAIASNQVQQKSTAKSNIEVVLATLFKQGLKLINLETFEGETQSAFAIAKEMASINASHESSMTLFTMLDAGVSIKVREFELAGNLVQGQGLVQSYTKMLTDIGLQESPWIAEFKARTVSPLEQQAKTESQKIAKLKAEKEVRKLSSRDIRTLLNSAKELMRRDKYFLPASGNAFDKVKMVLDFDPKHEKALSYYDKIFNDLVEDAIDKADEGDYQDARDLVLSGLAKVNEESRLMAALEKISEIEKSPKKTGRRVVGGF
jgi:regulator of extracellular matrix RemA (YlzA/DUF370 family)